MLKTVDQSEMAGRESRGDNGHRRHRRVRRRAANTTTESQRRRLQGQQAAAEVDRLILRVEQAGEPLDRLCWMTGITLKVVLLASGYHQHARGRWRRWRGHHRGGK